MTRILALETSGTGGSLAALQDEKVLCQAELNPEQRSARSLAPGIAKLLKDLGWQPRDVQLVAVTAGPGSFTGLRIGLTTARTFAYAVGAELLGINSLEVLASQAPAEAQIVRTVVDAQRQELFAATYRRQGDGRIEAVGEGPAILGIDTWLTSLAAGDTVIGPVLTKLKSRLPPFVYGAPESNCVPQALTVGRIAAHRFAAGERHSLWTLTPLYLRRSAAEEKADARS
jgi:tRNA threonylcarbamoyladenosine biosynthesis protein TsaB